MLIGMVPIRLITCNVGYASGLSANSGSPFRGSLSSNARALLPRAAMLRFAIQRRGPSWRRQ